MIVSGCSILYRSFPDREIADLREAIKPLAKAGFKGIEVDLMRPQETLERKDWKEWSEEVRKIAEEENVEITSAHAPIANICMLETGAYEYVQTLMRRAIDMAGIMGAKWVVIHPGTVFNGVWDKELSLKVNLEFLRPLLTRAKERNVGLALENVYDWETGQHEFAAETKNLCELVDALDDEYVGICWDFGHSNLVKEDQAAAIRYAGSRIKTLHVHDNSGEIDEHLIPYLGTTDWKAVMEALKDIGFDGSFNMETHRYVQNHPETLRPTILQFCREVGEHLMAMAGKETI